MFDFDTTALCDASDNLLSGERARVPATLAEALLPLLRDFGWHKAAEQGLPWTDFDADARRYWYAEVVPKFDAAYSAHADSGSDRAKAIAELVINHVPVEGVPLPLSDEQIWCVREEARPGQYPRPSAAAPLPVAAAKPTPPPAALPSEPPFKMPPKKGGRRKNRNDFPKAEADAWLRELVELYGSQARAAAAIGFSRPLVSKWVRGVSQPNDKQIRKVERKVQAAHKRRPAKRAA